MCVFINVVPLSIWHLLNWPCFIYFLFCSDSIHRKQVRFIFFAVWPTRWPHPPPAASPLSSLCASLIGSPPASVQAAVGGTQTIHSCFLRCGRNATADPNPGRQPSGSGSIHSVHRRTRSCQRDSDDKLNLSKTQITVYSWEFSVCFRKHHSPRVRVVLFKTRTLQVYLDSWQRRPVPAPGPAGRDGEKLTHGRQEQKTGWWSRRAWFSPSTLFMGFFLKVSSACMRGHAMCVYVSVCL